MTPEEMGYTEKELARAIAPFLKYGPVASLWHTYRDAAATIQALERRLATLSDNLRIEGEEHRRLTEERDGYAGALLIIRDGSWEPIQVREIARQALNSEEEK